jgi:hypothetical protein
MDNLALKLAMLEAEVEELRELLSDMKASEGQRRPERNELRQDRDYWHEQSERPRQTPAGLRQRAWFCGRASSRN